jgi:hypothetical protein
MKIQIKSEKSKKDWISGGEQITYSKNFLIRKGTKKYSTLSFKYKFKFDDDVVSFSYSLPYTYSKL